MIKETILHKTLFYLFAIFFILTIGFPFFWQILNSFKMERDIFALTWFPSQYTVDNYVKAFTTRPLLSYLGNSFVIATFATIFSLVLGSMAAYAIARTPIKGKTPFLILVMSISLLPPIVIISPIYSIIRAMGLLNSYAGLIIVNVLFTLTVVIWFLTPYLHAVPKELEEAAEIDGASPAQAFSRIVIPLLGPGVFTVGILAFIQIWNEYLFALVLNPIRIKTVTVGLKMYESDNYMPWGTIMAAAVIIVVPLITLVLILQKRIIGGLMAGGIKE
ncbi:MAG: carbohydrate ABC transporter permease [Sphaerochaeta sp.]|nr:carbohydrate ABC transporter permease [Sphaerochaeta sp.]